MRSPPSLTFLTAASTPLVHSSFPISLDKLTQEKIQTTTLLKKYTYAESKIQELLREIEELEARK